MPRKKSTANQPAPVRLQTKEPPEQLKRMLDFLVEQRAAVAQHALAIANPARTGKPNRKPSHAETKATGRDEEALVEDKLMALYLLGTRPASYAEVGEVLGRTGGTVQGWASTYKRFGLGFLLKGNRRAFTFALPTWLAVMMAEEVAAHPAQYTSPDSLVDWVKEITSVQVTPVQITEALQAIGQGMLGSNILDIPLPSTLYLPGDTPDPAPTVPGPSITLEAPGGSKGKIAIAFEAPQSAEVAWLGIFAYLEGKEAEDCPYADTDAQRAYRRDWLAGLDLAYRIYELGAEEGFVDDDVPEPVLEPVLETSSP